MTPARPEPVKLFVGMLYSDANMLEQAVGNIKSEFGSIDYRSPEFSFDISDYYKEEMGWPIWRKFISFFELVDPGDLANIKLATNRLEEELTVAGKRRVNLDPGYMDYNKVILASAKYNSQKIYLADGIYADPTLWYENGSFHPYPYSFPDFKSNLYEAVFLHMRALFKGQRRKLDKESMISQRSNAATKKLRLGQTQT